MSWPEGHKKEVCQCYVCRAIKGECFGKNNSFYGKRHSEETKEKWRRTRNDGKQLNVNDKKETNEIKKTRTLELDNLLSKSFLIEHYCNKRMTLKEIAELCGTHASVVFVRINKYNIETRSTAEMNEGRKRPDQSEFMKKNNPMKRAEFRAKVGQKGKENPMYGKKSPMRGKKNPGASKAQTENWQDPTWRRKTVEAIVKASHIKPNKAEMELNDFLRRILPKEYKYVGSGEFILAGKCPDFTNVNGQKKLIELFGDYWHKGDDGEERIELFRQYGYETLIIWEHELKDERKLKDKILSFNEEKGLILR